MNYHPTISYPETVDNNVTFKSIQDVTGQHLVGGHVEFSVLDETYVHFFTSAKELEEMRLYLKEGKILTGLKQFIARNYAPTHQMKERLTDEHVIIWNYEFHLS